MPPPWFAANKVAAAPRPQQMPASPSRHLPELDALRGVAAMVVLLNHFQAAWLRTAHPAWLAHPAYVPPLWLLLNGHASVILFFLLSGFVLSLPRLHGARPGYAVYVLRRICRIYLPYLAALLVSVAACSLFFRLRLDGRLLPEFWPQRPDLASLLQHAAMLGRLNVWRYDGPAWSLVHEMRISLIFPLLLFCALRLRVLATFLFAAGFALAGSISLARLELNVPEGAAMVAWSYTLSYCGIFLLGAGLARRYQAYAHAVDSLKPVSRGALFAGAMVLYLYPPPVWHRLAMGDFCVACGALVVLTFALRQQGWVATLLRQRPMQFLGTISYSLYLLHFPILAFLSSLASARYSFGWLLLPFIATSILAAMSMYRAVEMPSMALGRRVRNLSLPSFAALPVGLSRNQQ